MAAIIGDEAPALHTSVPAPLRWVVERCLAKDPAERYDSTKDVYRELTLARGRLSEASGTQAVSAVRQHKGRVWVIAAVAASRFAAISWLLWRIQDGFFDLPS